MEEWIGSCHRHVKPNAADPSSPLLQHLPLRGRQRITENLLVVTPRHRLRNGLEHFVIELNRPGGSCSNRRQQAWFERDPTGTDRHPGGRQPTSDRRRVEGKDPGIYQDLTTPPNRTGRSSDLRGRLLQHVLKGTIRPGDIDPMTSAAFQGGDLRDPSHALPIKTNPGTGQLHQRVTRDHHELPVHRARYGDARPHDRFEHRE